MAICGNDKKSKKEKENKDPNAEGQDDDEESSVQSHHPEDLSMFETPQERIEYLSRRRRSNPMPRMNRNSDDSESVFSYDSNGMPYKSEKKGKCCSKKCWGRTWRTDLCCLIPATAVIAAPIGMVMFCNGAFVCRNVPEGFTEDAENWTDDMWEKWLNMDGSNTIKDWREAGNGESTDGMIADNFLKAATQWMYDYLRDGNAEDIRTLRRNADDIFGNVSVEELQATRQLLQNDTCGDQMQTLFTDSISELATRFEYQADLDGNGKISYDEAHAAIDKFFFTRLDVQEGGGGELWEEAQEILNREGENGEAMKQFVKRLVNDPQLRGIFNDPLSSDGNILKEMQEIVAFWDRDESERLQECVTTDEDVLEALEFFFPEDMGAGWNPFFEIIFRFDDNLAEAQANQP